MAKGSKRRSNKNRSSRKVKGGSCGSAWQNATAVFGGPNEQHAVSNTSNQIAMNQQGGGKKRKVKGGSCGSAWQNATAVFGGPGEQHAVSNTNNQIAMTQQGGGSNLNPAGYGENVPLSDQAYAVIDAGSASDATNVLSNMTGGAKKRRGGSIISEIAVPAVLLVANEAFKRRSKKVFNWKGTKGKNKIFSAKRRNSGKVR